MIEHHWNKADALEWLAARVDKERAATKPSDVPWPPAIACCEEVPPWEKAKAGEYVTWGPGRVMVIDEIRTSEIVLEDPFDTRGKYPISVTREKWDHVLATTEERVKSEFVRLNPKIPTEKPPKDDTGDKAQTVRKRPAAGKRPADRKRPLAAIGGTGASEF